MPTEPVPTTYNALLRWLEQTARFRSVSQLHEKLTKILLMLPAEQLGRLLRSFPDQEQLANSLVEMLGHTIDQAQHSQWEHNHPGPNAPRKAANMLLYREAAYIEAPTTYEELQEWLLQMGQQAGRSENRLKAKLGDLLHDLPAAQLGRLIRSMPERSRVTNQLLVLFEEMVSAALDDLDRRQRALESISR